MLGTIIDLNFALGSIYLDMYDTITDVISNLH